jgi:hypothetical protein
VGYTYPALHLNWSTRKKKNIFSVFFLTWLRPIESFSVGNLLLTWAWEGLTSTQRGRKQESPSAFKWTSNRAGSSDWH